MGDVGDAIVDIGGDVIGGFLDPVGSIANLIGGPAPAIATGIKTAAGIVLLPFAPEFAAEIPELAPFLAEIPGAPGVPGLAVPGAPTVESVVLQVISQVLALEFPKLGRTVGDALGLVSGELGTDLPGLNLALSNSLGLVSGELGTGFPVLTDALRALGLSTAEPLAKLGVAGDIFAGTAIPELLKVVGPLLDAFGVHVPAIRDALRVLEGLSRGRPGAARRNFDELLLDATQDQGLEVPDWVKALIGGLAVAAVAFASRAARAVGQVVGEVGRTAGELVEGVAGGAFEGIEFAHAGATAVVEGGARIVFDKLRDQLDGLGESTPENVDRNATKLLATATGLGMTAHLLSELTETVYFTKHLGLPNLAAFLVDMASYRPMADALLGAEYDAALREPARRRALARFRSHLPPAVVFDQMFLEGQVTPDEFTTYYREQGWSDRFIEAHRQEVFREASLFALASALEDVEVDPRWVDRQLMEQGFDEESVTNLRRALGVRSQKSVRGQLLGAAGRARKAGLLTDAGAEKLLAPLRLRPEAVALWQAATGMDRLVDEAEELKRVLEDAAARGALDDAGLRAELAALSYDESAQEQAVQRARRRRGLESFEQETKEAREVMRRTQATAITAALERHRRLELSDGDLARTLAALGVREEEASAIVDRARVRLEPVPQLATVLSPDAQAQRLLDLRADAILTDVRRRAIDPALAEVALLGLGTEPTRAAAEVALAVSRRVAAPAPPKPPPEPVAAREARELRTEAVLARLREGLLSPAQARASLAQLGHPLDVVAALLEREAGRAEAAAARAAVRAETQAFEAQRKALEDAALAAFRRGDLEAPDLLGLLVALGRPQAVAEALVTREVARRPARTAPARPPESSAAPSESRGRA